MWIGVGGLAAAVAYTVRASESSAAAAIVLPNPTSRRIQQLIDEANLLLRRLTIKGTAPSPDRLASGQELEVSFSDLLANGQAVGRAGYRGRFFAGPLLANAPAFASPA